MATWGVFQAFPAGTLTGDELRLLELLLGYTGEALKRVRQQNQLQEQAVRDPLTRLYNRRYLAQMFEQELGPSKGYSKPVAFLVTDINLYPAPAESIEFTLHEADRQMYEDKKGYALPL